MHFTKEDNLGPIGTRFERSDWLLTKLNKPLNAPPQSITLRHKKYDLLVTKCSLIVLDRIWAADSESEVGFALSPQNFE